MGSINRFQVIDPALLHPADPSPLTSAQEGPHQIGWMVDSQGVWRCARDGIFPTFSPGPSMIGRYNRNMTQRNFVVAVSVVMGNASTAQVGAALRTTSANGSQAMDVAFLNGPSGELMMGRIKTGTGSFEQYPTAWPSSGGKQSVTVDGTTEYTIFFSGYNAAVGDTSVAETAWAVAEATWGTELCTRLAGTEDNGNFDNADVTYGGFANAIAATKTTKITRIRAWDWDGTTAVIAWADSDPAGPKLKCTTVKPVGSLSSIQWARCDTADGTFVDLTGATTADWTDTTAVEGTLYFYKATMTYSTSGAKASEVVYARKQPATLKIGFIGTSWMAIDSGHYASSSPIDATTAGYANNKMGTIPQLVGTLLAARAGRQVTVTNQGVNGSTSAQWVSGQTNMTTALAAFASAGTTHVYVDAMGLNDISGSVSAATHKANLQDICATLLAAGYKVLLGYSGMHFPSNPAGRGIPELTTLLQYNAANDEVANSTSIRRAGAGLVKLIADNPGGMQDLLHPSQIFSYMVAELIAADFYEHMLPRPHVPR